MEMCGILVDLDRCVGCYACEVACKQENHTLPDTPWIRLKIVGPEIVNGQLRTDFIPLIMEDCDLCKNREGRPSCVDHCPTAALRLCDSTEILDALNSKRRLQICTIK